MRVKIRQRGLVDYTQTWHQMQSFTDCRDEQTKDEIWIVEHPPVYTLGLNGQKEHLLRANRIPVVKTDRGGQVTYHAPGQLVVYVLLNLPRLRRGVREMITILEQAMLHTLSEYGIQAESKADAPGVYVNQQKIGAVGLRVRKKCCYHGLSLNNAMDLTPFDDINPCGYADLTVTQLADLNIHIKTHELAVPVVHHLLQQLSYAL